MNRTNVQQSVAGWSVSQGRYYTTPGGDLIPGNHIPNTTDGILVGIDHLGETGAEVRVQKADGMKLDPGAYRISFRAQLYSISEGVNSTPSLRAYLRGNQVNSAPYNGNLEYVAVHDLQGAEVGLNSRNHNVAPLAFNKTFILTVPTTTVATTETYLGIVMYDLLPDSTPQTKTPQWFLHLEEIRFDRIR